MKIQLTGNGQVVAEIIRKKGSRAPAAWAEANQRMADFWRDALRELSATQYASTQQLRRLGHPYSRRGFRANGKQARAALPMPAEYINRQSGKLYGSWFVKPYQIGPDTTVIFATVPDTIRYFRWLVFGTRKMIPRPILQAALGRAHQQFRGVYEDAQKRIHGYR